MRVSILLQITADDGSNGTAQEVVSFEKATECPEDVGLSLADGKALLAAVQRRIVETQAAEWAGRRRCCKACGVRRRSKGSYPVVFRTLYGGVELDSPRLHCCSCQASDGPVTVSPLRALIPGHVAPERLYLEARWASLVPYAAAAGLLADVLPIASGANATTLRRHVLWVAERAEAELGEERPSFVEGCHRAAILRRDVSEADGGAVGRAAHPGRPHHCRRLDGGYVRDWADRKANFELIVGRSIPEDRAPRYLGPSCRFAACPSGGVARTALRCAMVHGYDQKPKRRLFEVMREQGLQANQDVTFLTDGGYEVRALTELVTPDAEHVLDWFHIAMRLTVLEQYARGVAHHDKAEGARLLRDLERTKWLLWHCNVHRALQTATWLEADVDGLELDYPHLGKFARAAREFAVYVSANRGSLINYGERFRSGERISSAMAESTVNCVVSKRFAKRHGMQWTRRGAHLLLQTRTSEAPPAGVARTAPRAKLTGRPRRNAPAPVRALASRARQRQRNRHRSGRGGVSTPHFVMVPPPRRGLKS